MQAWVLHGARDIRLESVRRPHPGPGEVLVQVAAAGVCGSDLHYHAAGRCGHFIPTRPFILGHEFAGTIAEHGPGVESPVIGTRVAVDPSQPCGRCTICRNGRYNLCPEMVYFGSASVTPPRDGCFAEYVVAPAGNCAALPADFKMSWGAMLEPLSVAAHALQRSGGVAGKSVLITGGGTIGQMISMIAQAFGSSQVAVSDPRAFARSFTEQHGAASLDPTGEGFGTEAAGLALGGFEVVFEASGVAAALDQAIRLSAPGATVVQVGTLEDGVPVPVNALLTRELSYVGSWRFANVFDRVISLVTAGRINPEPLLTHTFGFRELPQAIQMARDGDESVKVQIVFDR